LEENMTTFREDHLSYRDLLLDPNNYRYQDNPDFVYADERRFHEPGVQSRAFRRLRDEESLLELKNSFLTNGFIPVERLVVRPYPHADAKYLVLEGNRRLAALMWIADDHEAGVVVADFILESLEAVPVIVVEGGEDPAFFQALMGVRHVSGIRQWGGYQRAKLVVTLKDQHELASSEIADRLGMSVHEVNRRYRAFKALQQMQDDENYGEYAKPSMYPLYHEAVSLPTAREWLGWKEEEGQFTEETQREQFYELVTPNEVEEGRTQEPKIRTYSQVRELRNILPSPEAKRVLLDPNRSFFDAVAVAKRDELSRSWKTQIAEAIDALQTVSVIDLEELSSEDLEQLEKLKELSQRLLDTYLKLTG
jgi:hypothetical protein